MRLVLLGMLCLLASAASSAAAVITDSRGEHEFHAVPERVVALSWSLAEQVLELGITPVGIADVDGYTTWVVQPPIPEGVASLGLRQEPNLERIAELEPDVILVSDDQIGLVPQLERIAPVLHFDSFSAQHDNQERAREIFLELAELFGRQTLAHDKLAELDQRLGRLAEAIRHHFGATPPKVTIVRFLDTARLVIHGDNALPVAALEALGLENGYPLPATRWGITIKRVQDLGRVEDGHILYIEPFEQRDELFSSPLWNAMPFVRDGRVIALPSTWTYGGAMSVGYLADAIAEALLQLPPR